MTKYISIMIFAVIIKLAIAASTFHPDIRAFWLGGGLVASGHLLNLYDYLPSLPRNNFVVQVFTDAYLNYPPAIYFFHGLFNFIFSSIFGLDFMNKYLIENKNIFGDFDLNMQILFLKLPYILVDIFGAFLIVQLFEDKKQKFFAFLLWVFNPVNIYATYMMAQFDIIPTVFIILALVLVKKDMIKVAAIALGLGIAFKIFPIFLLVPLALLGKDLKSRVVLFVLGVLPYILSVLPFLSSTGYKNSAFFTSQTMKSFIAEIPISSGERLILFPLILIGTYLYWYYVKNHSGDLWRKFLIVLLIFFILTHYHPQWFIWVTPLLIIDLVKNNFKYIFLHLILLFTYIASIFFFEASLNVNLFAPAFPNLYTQPTIWNILNIKIDLNYMRSLTQTIFTTAAVVLIYFKFKEHNSAENPK